MRAMGIPQREMASAFAGRRAVWPVRFPDRAAAGLLLGECLRLTIGDSYPERTVVTALPRGGVAVGAGVARCLGVPLEVLVTRKIGHPDEPEVGLGAMPPTRAEIAGSEHQFRNPQSRVLAEKLVPHACFLRVGHINGDCNQKGGI